jgi:integrase
MGIYYRKFNGRMRYRVRVTYRGVQLTKLCDTQREAKCVEAELLTQLRATHAQRQVDGERPVTLRAALEAYVADLEDRGKATDSVIRAVTTAKAVAALLPNVIDRPVHECGAKQIFMFRKARSQRCRPSGVNRDLRTLRAVLRKVTPGFRFPRDAFYLEDETRVRWLTPDNEAVVFPYLRAPFDILARLASLTMMRLTEVGHLRRSQIHLDQDQDKGVLVLPKAKGGPDTIVLSQLAIELLRQQLASHTSPWVFPNPWGRPYSRVHISRVWRRVAEKFALQDFHFHDLRHHGATVALNAGFSASVVMALGRWKTERMMRRYAAVTDKTLRAAAEAVSAGIGGKSRDGRRGDDENDE